MLASKGWKWGVVQISIGKYFIKFSIRPDKLIINIRDLIMI